MSGYHSDYIGNILPAAADGDALVINPNTDQWAPSSGAWNCGTSIVELVKLENTTPALVDAQQCSPALVLGGQGWATDTSESMSHKWALYDYIESDSTTPVGELRADVSVDGGNYATKMQLTSLGVMYCNAFWANNYIISTNYVRSPTFYVSGDCSTGSSAYFALTNTSVAAASGSVALDNAPTGYTTPRYIKAFDGETECVLVALTKTS